MIVRPGLTMGDDGPIALNLAQALDFIERVQSMDDSAQVIAEFERIIDRFGCSMFSAGLVENPTRISTPILISTWPEEWQEHWVEKKLWHVDPIVHANLVRTEPFEWKDIFQISSREGRQVFYEARAFGLADGFTVPSHHLSGPINTVTVVGEKLDWSPKERAMMHLLSLYFVGTLKRLMSEGRNPDEDPSPKFTPREIQVINYIASGKTSSEVSDILSISENTVNFHMKRILTKLDCHTRTQAVVEAYRRGYLRP